MPIANVTKEIALGSANTLNLPISNGIDTNGYWFIYIPNNAGNSTTGSNIKPYKWETILDQQSANTITGMDGSIGIIQESWEGSTIDYHGSAIQHIGAGTNAITGTVEDDAFFFVHQGAAEASDDVFYWDRMYLDNTTSEWLYYQYHQHSPPTLPAGANTRITMAPAGGYIVPSDKAYGYQLGVAQRTRGTDYATVLGRVHTPSIGGAHNSHNDVTLPSGTEQDYMAGGILTGSSDRFHAFYISANSTNWDVFSRTYSDSTTSFSTEVSLGVYDLADPTFSPLQNYSQYPVRASCGDKLSTNIYVPVIYNNGSNFDLKIWKMTDGSSLSSGSLTVENILTNVAARPDCQIIARSGTSTVYALVTDPAAGGVSLYTSTGDGTWTDEGQVVTNVNTNYVRVHGFRYDSTTTKYYCLLSGTQDNSGTYTGSGLYSFQLTGAFQGYSHLDYDTANSNVFGSFIVKDPLVAGFLKFDHVTGMITRDAANTEPEGIASNVSIMTYDVATPEFHNKVEVNTKSNEYYNMGITLSDGRKALAGRTEDGPTNRGDVDIFLSLVEPDGETISFSWGGSGDDYFTGLIEDTDNNCLWLSGYGKSEFAEKKDIWKHGFVRQLSYANTYSFSWNDSVVDTTGNIYLAGTTDGVDEAWDPGMGNGSYSQKERMVVAKYNANFEIQWQKEVLPVQATGYNTNLFARSIDVDSSGDVYVSFRYFREGVDIGSEDVDYAVRKFSGTDGTTQWTKIINISSFLPFVSDNQFAPIVSIVANSSSEYLCLAGTERNFGIPEDRAAVIAVCNKDTGDFIKVGSIEEVQIHNMRSRKSNDGKILLSGSQYYPSDSSNAIFIVYDTSPSTMSSETVFVYGDNTSKFSQDTVGRDIDVFNTANSENIYQYIAVGTDGLSNTFYLSLWANSTTQGVNWANTSSSMAAGTSTPVYVSCMHTSEGKRAFIACNTTSLGTTNITGSGASINSVANSGIIDWTNSFGGSGTDTVENITFDSIESNFIIVGGSSSQSTGGTTKDGYFARFEKYGFGQGIYHKSGAVSNTYYYSNTSSAIVSSGVSNKSTTSYTVVESATGASTMTNGPLTDAGAAVLTSTNYDSAWPTSKYSGFLVKCDLAAIQTFKNSAQHKSNKINDIRVTANSDMFTFHQVATAGDGVADDGNVFCYDLIKHTDGRIYSIWQTSGSVQKINTGTSGVYDYMLNLFTVANNDIEFYQNGTADDEEAYALTEISDANNSVLFVGRTTGTIGNTLFGGIDIFLGRFNPTDDSFSYRSTGSGNNGDRALNVHDLGTSNQAIVVIETDGELHGKTPTGGKDIGVIYFDYTTFDFYGAAGTFLKGSASDEQFDQEGKISTNLGDGRIAMVTRSPGTFADDGVTFGNQDIGLAIFDTNANTFTSFQTGSTASDIPAGISSIGSDILISGWSFATFDFEHHGVYVNFDASKGLVGKNSV